MEPAVWAAVVGQVPLDRAGRLVARQLADRSTAAGRVNATAGDLAASCCLPVTVVADLLAHLASWGLLARERGGLVLTLPGGGWSR